VMWGNEGYGTAVRFVHSCEERGDGWRRTAHWRGSEQRLSGTVPRRKKEKGTGWAMGWSGEKTKKKMNWAEMENRLRI
jgi:hypothetical protein